MAGARDQAARVVRQEPGAARQAPETAEGEAARDAAAPLADQLRTHVAEEAKRRPGDAPGAPPADRPAAPPADAASSGRAQIRQAQEIRDDGRGRIAGARRRQLRRLFRFRRTLLCLDRRRLCARQQHHARRAGRGPCRRDPSRRQFDRSHRRRDLQDRRRRLQNRGGCGAHQDRDPAGHHRSHRPPGHRAGKRGRAGRERSSLPRKRR